MDKKLTENIKRVLVCEHDRDIASSLCVMAQQIGLAADIARDAVQAKQMLAQGNYAAMTLDLMLPGQEGIALIRELRAAKGTAALPILVVSVNATEMQKELHGETFNVIEWIDKPVNQAYLVETLKQAVEQVSNAQSLLSYGNIPKKDHHDKVILELSLPDGFDAVMNQLGREVARAKRKKVPLSLAMIGIDLFGQIDDTYGDLAGDRLIQSLSRLLKQRLRQTDLIGRCGGEEFAIILCDTDGATAVTVLDKIRKEFSGLRHFEDGKEFSVTFSCGIADIARFDDAAKLGDAAGQALYKAKQAGQDQMVLA
ncbi:MAG: diguanylate cyclase [Gallionella sp.]|nr:diguanylate cyclase [Gallionella sp.]